MYKIRRDPRCLKLRQYSITRNIIYKPEILINVYVFFKITSETTEIV